MVLRSSTELLVCFSCPAVMSLAPAVWPPRSPSGLDSRFPIPISGPVGSGVCTVSPVICLASDVDSQCVQTTVIFFMLRGSIGVIAHGHGRQGSMGIHKHSD